MERVLSLNGFARTSRSDGLVTPDFAPPFFLVALDDAPLFSLADVKPVLLTLDLLWMTLVGVGFILKAMC